MPYLSFFLITASYQSYWLVWMKTNDLDFKLFSVGIFILVLTSLFKRGNDLWMCGMISSLFGAFFDMIKQLTDNNLIIGINSYLMLFLMILTPVYFIIKTKKITLMANDTQEAEVTKQVKGTTTLSFADPTPRWATWVFRVEFFLNKALLMWITSTNIVAPEHIKGVVATLAAIDFFVWGIGRSIGVKPPENDAKN